jgi:hypothetical protein
VQHAPFPNLRLVRPARTILLAVAFCLLFTASAAASPVLVLDHGKVRHADDPALPAAVPEPALPASSTAKARRAAKVSAAQATGPNFKQALAGLLAGGSIDQATYNRAKRAYDDAKRSYKNITGLRKNELKAVIDNADGISRRGFATPTRMLAMTETLERNKQWWTTQSIPRANQRVEFAGSQLVWQYYPGQGIELQMLGTWGKVNGLTSRERFADDLQSLLDELIPLGSERGGALAWEYYFQFDGGLPPWTSGLSQATALQALARSSQRLERPDYLELVQRGLGIFEMPPPNGVRVDGGAGQGPHYLIYTFAPDLRVINAFLQSVIGLYDVAQITADPRAGGLYAAAEKEAEAEVPAYNTGSWSLYSQARESDLSYHNLVTGFLRGLCDRLGVAVYCQTADAFTGDLKVAPIVTPVTRRVRGGEPAKLSFKLSKISRVGLTVVDANGKTVFSTSSVVGYGQREFAWSKPPAKAGLYTLRVRATDLAGNQGPSAEGPLRVLKARKKNGGGKTPNSDQAPPLPPQARR